VGGSKIVGIVTERDYARNVVLKGRASPQTLVGEIMGRNVVCVEPDKSIEECMAIMSAKRVRHLSVINASELLGIVSIGDGQEHNQRQGVRDRAVGALHPRGQDVDRRARAEAEMLGILMIMRGGPQCPKENATTGPLAGRVRGWGKPSHRGRRSHNG
jgi:hypothetical protein